MGYATKVKYDEKKRSENVGQFNFAHINNFISLLFTNVDVQTQICLQNSRIYPSVLHLFLQL